MSDVGIQVGDVPGGPPVNLPAPPGSPRPRIVVTPDPSRAVPWVPSGNAPVVPSQGDPHAFIEDWAPPPGEKGKETKANADPHAFIEDWAPTEAKPQPEVSGVQAAVSGGLNALSFGFAPAIAGLAEAAGPEWQAVDIYQNADKPVPNPVAPIVGAAKLLGGYLSGHPDQSVRDAYERGRQAALEHEQAAHEQHPYAYFAGQLAGAVVAPGFGAMRVGSAAARTAAGVGAGAVGGGLYGAGTATSEGGDLSDVAKGAGVGAALGGALGGAVGGVLGPRVAPAVATPGQRAAQTAQDLGAPLPRGLASDSRAIQATTAKLRSVPFAGEKIGERVGETAEAAGNRIGDIADTVTGGVTDRAAADALVRPALQDVVDTNRQAIDAAYGNVRSQIDQTQQFTMPRTDAALNGIMRDRAAAGWSNPAQGLEQFRNVAGGATFDGAHRARVDARSAGDVLVPHPGYNKADYNRITRAMTADIRDMVGHAATGNPRDALAAFDEAERQFGVLAERNALLHQLINARGEGAIGTLLGAAKEKSGNLRLLAQLRRTMDPAEFDAIGGVLLHELGKNPTTGEFSLAKFVTEWGKVSDRAKSVLFSPQHLQSIEDIFQLGQHIKGALSYSNTSHTASVLVMLDLAKDAALLGADIASGGLGLGSAIGAGTSAATVLLTRWLASPAKAASMSAWARAYRAVAAGGRSAAQISAFNMATRNLAHNLGIPAQSIINSVRLRLGRSDVSPSGDQQPQNE